MDETVHKAMDVMDAVLVSLIPQKLLTKISKKDAANKKNE